MKKPYLIALDLDGTLLNDNKVISQRTKNAVLKAKQEGHVVCISTGRPYRASTEYYKELGLNTPIVNFNGAFVHHPHDSSFGVYHSPLELSQAKKVIKTAEEFLVKNIMAEVLDDVYLHKEDQVIVDTFIMGENPAHTGDLNERLNDNPTSLLIHPQDHHVNELRDQLKKEHAEVIDQRVWAAPWNIIEVIRSGLNKAVGLQKISAYYNIPKERVIAFGDEDNDLEMIEYAGHGIAMGNAISELKNIANHVTKTNEEDGIALYLEEVLALNM
ncbi:Cof-type HAD-IIB family hydrolase [Fictibacillus fluitans]|uniref:Cof-type HAD-IIB family hydrolase n=1 Tax=Fictibacillus fluitans TaxID=3058422 RepID=A0ABT8HSE7_9BACL|nr:Cof-type HAD-IIB family hydrolase [Fictibacillus sp. NE201]MDN4523694.1 Cof-type HAD-IIB family hydrolase [Fictibacillus sp. NE201]